MRSPLTERTPVWLSVVCALLFVLLLGEALLLAPPADDGVGPMVTDWMTGRWQGYEPLSIVHFQLMGVWPMVLLAMTAPWLRGRPIPLWPFALGSFALGGFALLPGLALPRRTGASVWGLRSRWMGVLLAVPTMALVVWGVVAGDASAWWQAAQADQFMHIMAWDFVALWLTSVAIAQARDGRGLWCAVPLFGACAWLFTVREDGP